jgi:PKD repeat protein
MTTPIRHRALGLLLGAALVLAAGAPARAAAAGPSPGPPGVADARISAPFVMRGHIVTAVRVHGEHRGQAITRRWTFTGVSCARSVCPRLALRRQRSAHHFDRLTLSRVGIGSYAGRGRFYAALRCRGRLVRRALVVPFQVTVQVAQVVAIQGIAFASGLTATYTNLHRIDRTRCPIGPSHDAAQYTGVAAPLPSPPAPAFSVAVHRAVDGVTVTDTSVPGAGGARIVSRLWQFGDPASGPADTATTPEAQHTFSAPGAYQVSLSVTDANGLTATAVHTVTAPGPPTVGFTETRLGTSETYALDDTSQPGVGGAPIVQWLWGFGDPHSSADESSARNPRHTFSGPGTYQVCLIVTDANGRHSGTCAAVVVPPAGSAAQAQASNWTVASTALSSPIS